jgi:hypothetical protein
MYHVKGSTIGKNQKPSGSLVRISKSMRADLDEYYAGRRLYIKTQKQDNQIIVKKYNSVYFKDVDNLMGWGDMYRFSGKKLANLYWREVEEGYEGFASLTCGDLKTDKASMVWWNKLFEKSGGNITPIFGDPEDDTRWSMNYRSNMWIQHSHGLPELLPPGEDDNFIVCFEGRETEPDWFTIRNHINRIDYTAEVDSATGETSYKGYACATADGGDHFIELDWWKGILMTYHVKKCDEMPPRGATGWRTFENTPDTCDKFSGCTDSCCVREVVDTAAQKQKKQKTQQTQQTQQKTQKQQTQKQQKQETQKMKLGDTSSTVKAYNVAFTVVGEEPAWMALNEKLAFMAYNTSEVDGVKQHRGFARTNGINHRMKAWLEMFPGATTVQCVDGSLAGNTEFQIMMECVDTVTFGVTPVK